MKTCNKCGIEKPFLEFGRNSKSKDGHAYSCKQCLKSVNAQRYAVPDYAAVKAEWHNTLRILA